MLISGYINGKDVRICLECRKGMMLADIIITNRKTHYFSRVECQCNKAEKEEAELNG